MPLIDEQYRKCVTYLVANVRDATTSAMTPMPIGTALLVSVPIAQGVSASVAYAVTAQHIIDMSRRFGPLQIRLNRADGYEDLPAPQDRWHEATGSDLAVALVDRVLNSYDVRTIPRSMFATEKYIVDHLIGVGDALFFVGLFSEHPGGQRSEPIVRFGDVAMMPRENITVVTDDADPPSTRKIRAYLAEAHSWGGHSGSPAFVYFPPDRFMGSVRIGGSFGTGPALLGLVQGHYDIPQKVRFVGDMLGTGDVPVNAGIAAIIPAEEILKVLDCDEFSDDREARYGEWKSRQERSP